MTGRRPLVLLVALLAGGCARQGAYHDYGVLARRSLSALFHGQRVTRAQAAAIPYASLGYSVGGGDEHLLVLATDTNGEAIWTSASHVVLTMRGGRIVRTVGLPHDLSALRPATGRALPPLSAALKAPYTSVRLADFPDRPAYDVSITCTTRQKGRQSVNILGTPVAAVRIDEQCRSDQIRWSFTDSYWLDPQTGMAWRSRQHVAPGMDAVTVEIFRPPG